MRKCITNAIPTVAALVLLAGCASTTLQSQWRDPGYTAGPFKKIFVIGLSARDVTARRIFEDVMVAKLMAVGVQAVPEWQYLKDEGQAGEGAVSGAVDATVPTPYSWRRLVAIDTRYSVTPVAAPGPGFGWCGGGMPAGIRAGMPRRRSRNTTVIVETSLFDT
jgi:hypothetical protein